MAKQTNKNPMYIPTEAEEQKALFQWADMESHNYPELCVLYHIPNGGSRNKIEAVHLKQQGVKSGVPDVCLPVAKGKYHGLYIEMKRTKGGRLSPEQKDWLSRLNANGYAAICCNGWLEAKEAITEYLNLKG